nr:hypothetical protein [Halorubrum sp. Atlit-28R]
MPDDKRGQDEDEDNEQPQQPERKREEVRDRAHEDRAMSGDPGGGLVTSMMHSQPRTTRPRPMNWLRPTETTRSKHKAVQNPLKKCLPQLITKRTTPPMMFEAGYWD